MWLNLRDGVISTLSTDSNLGVFTFDSQYDGQTAQEFTGRADAVVWNTVSTFLVYVSDCHAFIQVSVKSSSSTVKTQKYIMHHRDLKPVTTAQGCA